MNKPALLRIDFHAALLVCLHIALLLPIPGICTCIVSSPRLVFLFFYYASVPHTIPILSSLACIAGSVLIIVMELNECFRLELNSMKQHSLVSLVSLVLVPVN